MHRRHGHTACKAHGMQLIFSAAQCICTASVRRSGEFSSKGLEALLVCTHAWAAHKGTHLRCGWTKASMGWPVSSWLTSWGSLCDAVMGGYDAAYSCQEQRKTLPLFLYLYEFGVSLQVLDRTSFLFCFFHQHTCRDLLSDLTNLCRHNKVLKKQMWYWKSL